MGELVALLEGIRFDESPSGYGSTSDQQERVREVFFPHVGSLFPGEWPYAMVTVVHPNGGIPPHRDAPLPAGVRRYHLVLETNEYAWSLHDGEWCQFEAGSVYELDPAKLHASINWGSTPRIHLVVDFKGGEIVDPLRLHLDH